MTGGSKLIKTVIFDIGRVLVGYDWDEFYLEMYHDEVMARRVKEAFFAGGVWDEMDRGVWSEEELLRGFIANDPEIEKEIRQAWGAFGGLVYQYDFSRDWISGLKERGYQVLYLSNWSYHLLDLCRDALDFTELMDGGVFSCHVKLIKPDEAIYRCIIDKYGLNPEECVFLDDRQENIEAAIRCGMKGIVAVDHDEAAAKLEEYLRENI